MPSGTVKWFDMKKGYGYIQPDNAERDVKVNLLDVTASGWTQLSECQRLDYDLQPGYGTTIAVNLRSPFAKSSKGPRE
jgi:CspA family cold shock protein